jgi:hypothetical protein
VMKSLVVTDSIEVTTEVKKSRQYSDCSHSASICTGYLEHLERDLNFIAIRQRNA